MRKIILGLVTASTLLFGSLTNQSYNDLDLQILKSFDIEESYLHDPNFMDMRSSILKYRIDTLLKKYDEGFVFISTLKQMISEAGMPAEFLYLAMTESAFSPRAYSPKSASGLWQFIPETAKLYGLKIDSYVDERRDPIKSTRAAIKYLSYLHKKFGKWYLAALAYNCGDGKLSRAIQEAGTDNISVLLNPNKKYLPRESRNYIREILAVASAFNDVDFLSNSNLSHFLNRGAGKPLTTIKVKGGTNLEYIAKSAGLEVKDIKNFNRHLKHNFTPPYDDEYEVYIPYDNLSIFVKNFDPEKVPTNYYLIHNAKKGENLESIAKKYKISSTSIKQLNGLNSNKIAKAQELVIPINQVSDAKEIEVKNSGDKVAIQKGVETKKSSYTVKNGDTIYSISKKFNISTERIAQLNNLKNNWIKAGDVIVVSD